MVANPKKFQVMFLGFTRHRRLHLNIEGNKVSATGCVKLLGVEMYNKLKFDKHVKTLCLSRLNTYISREQTLICNAVLLSNYCPLLWLICTKGANKEINSTYKRVLRMLYEDYECLFDVLLTRSGSICIHAKNLQKLMIEIL